MECRARERARETREKEYEGVSVKRVEKREREKGGWKKKRRQNDETARWMEKVWSLRGRRKEVTREGRRG